MTYPTHYRTNGIFWEMPRSWAIDGLGVGRAAHAYYASTYLEGWMTYKYDWLRP